MLVALVRDAPGLPVGEKAAEALCVLSVGVRNKVTIAEEGGVEVLVAAVGSAVVAPRCREKAASALMNLAFDAHNQALIAAAGGIRCLVDMLQGSGAGGEAGSTMIMREKAAGALWNLAANNAHNKEAIREAGGIPALVDLVRFGSAEGQERAAAALQNLAAKSPDNQRDIALAGGIDALVGLLQDSVSSMGSEKVQFACSRALRNLAMDHEDNQARIVEGGGLAALRMLARQGSPRGKKNAARVLRCLTSPRLGGDECMGEDREGGGGRNVAIIILQRCMIKIIMK